jgi:hypothetical protein
MDMSAARRLLPQLLGAVFLLTYTAPHALDPAKQTLAWLGTIARSISLSSPAIVANVRLSRSTPQTVPCGARLPPETDTTSSNLAGKAQFCAQADNA